MSSRPLHLQELTQQHWSIQNSDIVVYQIQQYIKTMLFQCFDCKQQNTSIGTIIERKSQMISKYALFGKNFVLDAARVKLGPPPRLSKLYSKF